MNKIIIFNWKMNPVSFREAERILGEAIELTNQKKSAEIIVCPPFIWLAELSRKYANAIGFGGQDVFWENAGAYTGEISPAMLKNAMVGYAIVGHSERRKYLGEDDEIVNRKLLAAMASGLKAVLCVGEDLEVRQKGSEESKKFVQSQLENDLENLTKISKPEIYNLIIAYEPIWAIGTGVPATPEDALDMTRFIKNFLEDKFKIKNVPVLYGGSVNSRNINYFTKYDEIDGVLVGGASLKPSEFKGIL